MSLLNNAQKTIRADFKSWLEKYALILTLSSMLSGQFCATQVKDLCAAQDYLRAANDVIRNLPMEKNTNEPKSLNHFAADPLQGVSNQRDPNDVKSYINAAERVIEKKINFFTAAKNFSGFLFVLGFILEVVALLMPTDKERGRTKQTWT